MIKFNNIQLRRGADILFTNLSWTIYPKQRIGIIGANGSGKTSLFSLLLGDLHAEKGELDISSRIKLAHVAQETPAIKISALDFVLNGDQEYSELQNALRIAEDAHDGEKIATLHEKLAIIDGYTAPSRAAQLLDGLSFTQQDQTKTVAEFSGGWRVRLNLAKALMSRSDILLLDEPTNHLDLDAVLWLQQWLKNYSGTLLLISHDRDFLDETVNHIAHLEKQNIKLYTGNYSAFEKLRAAELLIQQAAYDKQQKQLAHLQSFVDRFRAKASKARQAQSRLKAIERMDLICAVQTESAFQFEFRPPLQCPMPLLTLDKAALDYGDKTILKKLNLSITPKDRIAILGPNGAGKSSFIKLLAGEINPAQGVRTASSGLKIGYFAQHQIDHLHLDDSALLHLKRLAPASSEQELRSFLGGFGFIGDTVFQPVKQFSGGEKSRLALSLIVWQRPNLLLLDEPTNHLDLEMRNALSIALQEYEGAMILVSHDRFLLRSTTDQLLLAAHGEISHFEGDLNDYEKWLIDYRKQQSRSTKKEREEMTQLISLDKVSLAYGLAPLLDQVKLQINKGERICLIGRNGAGKSSLLKIIDGTLLPDQGSVWRKPHLRLARLEQELPHDVNTTVYDFVSQGLAETGKLLKDYHAAILAEDLKSMEELQRKIDGCNGWQYEQQISSILTRLSLDPDRKLDELSGGWQKRVALAKALVISPELLLLDEPTNHLDIEAIEWLEEQLLSSGVGLLFITHDRALLKRLATRIIELDRGNLTSWPGDYENFLRRKEEMLHAEAKQNADFDKKLAQEEVWIRQGIKARRTRNEGRVRALQAMRLERSKRRNVQGKAAFALNEGEKSGQLVVEAHHIHHEFAGKVIIKDFSTRIIRGDRIGLIGPNGIGKSSLLNILLGNLQAQSGELHLGTNLQIAYFDQKRLALDLEKTVIDNAAQGSEYIEINGQKKHIISYLSDFLFTPERARTPVKALSGGECNRLLLAKLFSKPSNLLVMDEPTNDLDMETLELLEELLAGYQGTLLLVSHDRAFLDNVVTSTMVFEGNGVIEEYVGGYQDWLRQIKTDAVGVGWAKRFSAQPNDRLLGCAEKRLAQPTKLSYKEQRELENLPKLIEDLETEQKQIQELTASEEFYKQDQAVVTKTLARLNEIGEQLEQAFIRWDELESRIK